MPNLFFRLASFSRRGADQCRALLLGGLMLLLPSASALADDCVALGGSLVGGECQIASPQTKSGVFNLDQTLRILGTGNLTVPFAAGGNSLTLNINNGGNLIIDIPTTSSGGRIVGNVAGAGQRIGANITVNATGNIELKGNGGATDARITSDQTTGDCGVGSQGGNITLNADGTITIADGALVSANARCSAGAIALNAIDIVVDGTVESVSMLTGTGAVRRPGGGPITIDAACTLRVSPTGVVSSKGRDPGADLVHLEGGCEVLIEGLIESTGPGHGVPNNPPNHCNNANRPDKPSNSTACIEVWAGDSLIIDASGAKNGEINTDTAQSGGHQVAWIDLFANGPITISSNTTGSFAVHANESVTNADGGLITIISVGNAVTASGHAVQADATKAGGNGGKIHIGAKDDITLTNASIFARGDFNPTGGLGSGGVVSIKAVNGSLAWTSGIGDVRPTGADVPAAQQGSVTLEQCTNVPINTGTTTFPSLGAATTPALTSGLCGGTLDLPPYVVLPTCLCAGPPFCGDGNLDPGEQCDDGNQNNNDACRNDCTLPPSPLCGDGNLDPGEQCDDGNQNNGDGCEANCTFTPQPAGAEGCTPGYWKQTQHFDSWGPTGLTPGQDLDAVFTLPACLSTCRFGDDSLLDALKFGGGPTLCKKAQILLRAAVAAALNASHPTVGYPIGLVSTVISQVNTALASCNATTIISVKNVLDTNNNKGCPLN